MKATTLEKAQKEPDGKGRFQLLVGSCTMSSIFEGLPPRTNPQAQNLVRGQTFGFLVSPAGALLERGNPNLHSAYAPQVRRDFETITGQIANAYELTCLSLPNRQVQPRETWEARLPLLHIRGGIKETADVVATCTYEGCCPFQGQNHAVIRLRGHVSARPPGNSAVGGKVTGKIYFGLDTGSISQALMKVESEGDGSDAIATQALEVQLSRAPGNPEKIVAIALPPPPVKGRMLFQKLLALAAADPTDYGGKPGCAYKKVPLTLQAGKTYIIEMNKADQGPLDPYLLLHDPSGKKVAEDDDSGGDLNAMIVYKAPVSGTYQLYTTTFDPGQFGSFRLIISEAALPKMPKKKGKS